MLWPKCEEDPQGEDMSGTDKNVTLLVVTLGAFLTPYMSSAVNVALPVIGAEFKMSAVSLSWIATAYLLAAAVFLLPFGRLADICGRKRIFFSKGCMHCSYILLLDGFLYQETDLQSVDG